MKTTVSGNSLETIIVSALTSGIGYWAKINDDTEEFNQLYDKVFCVSSAIVEIILNGGEVSIESKSEEYKPKYKLSLNRLLKGIAMNIENRPWDCNMKHIDKTTADCIIQYAIFGDVLFS